MHHCLGEAGSFLRSHAAEENSHEQRGCLVVSPGALDHAAHECGDFFAAEGMAVAFPGDGGLGKNWGRHRAQHDKTARDGKKLKS